MLRLFPLPTVHPRRCGERISFNSVSRLLTGSSPQVRGTLPNAKPVSGTWRFIPAGAGNALLPKKPETQLPVHPRRCGERVPELLTHICRRGSSPQVRGTLFFPRKSPPLTRFIPAGAGNARPGGKRLHQAPVHPRRCGERAARAAIRSPITGSSPQVRGTPRPAVAPACRGRFIPAGAGNANHHPTHHLRQSVHPRRCGERCRISVQFPRHYGSSPQVRGTLFRSFIASSPFRFIPAGAGNARSNMADSDAESVHPRRCGERAGKGSAYYPGVGSSPQVRGTPWRATWCLPDCRLIPAGAGNAVFGRNTKRPPSVHPRRCGERLHHLFTQPFVHGSSPQVRGTLAARRAFSPLERFIPAGAGNASMAIKRKV